MAITERKPSFEDQCGCMNPHCGKCFPHRALPISPRLRTLEEAISGAAFRADELEKQGIHPLKQYRQIRERLETLRQAQEVKTVTLPIWSK